MTTHDYSAKSLFWMLINCTLIIAMVLGLIGIGTLIRYSNAVIPSRIITVSGEGKTSIKPDLATYTFSVVSQGTDPEKVQQSNTEKMNKAIAYVKEQGVKDADIKTSGYNLYPRYTYDKDSGNSKIDGYELTQTVTLKVRDLTNVGKLLSGLVRVGVNQAGNLQYSIENPEKQRAEARQQAFANAYEKATQMAAQNGVRIARVINFSENNYGGPIFYEKAMMSAAPMGRGGDMTPATEPGTEDVTVNVSVTYEIR